MFSLKKALRTALRLIELERGRATCFTKRKASLARGKTGAMTISFHLQRKKINLITLEQIGIFCVNS